jgi:hypothetical protein
VFESPQLAIVMEANDASATVERVKNRDMEFLR